MFLILFLLFTPAISLFSVSPMWAKQIAKQLIYSQNHCFFLRFCDLPLTIRRLCTRQDYLYPDVRGLPFAITQTQKDLHDCDSRDRPCEPPRLTARELRTRSATINEFQCLQATHDSTCRAPKIGRGTAVHGMPPFARTRLSVSTPRRPLSPLPQE